MTAKKKTWASEKAEHLDLRELCPHGGTGQGIIDDGSVCGDVAPEGRVWFLELSTDGKRYGARCILQTDGWKPKKGDLVMFSRQPIGVADDFLYADLLP